MHETFELVSTYAFSDSLTQYGDGIFETLLAVKAPDEHDGHAVRLHHWRYHWQRLHDSCRRLGIAVPDEQALVAVLQDKLQRAWRDNTLDSQALHCVVKIIVSRGAGLRGYASHSSLPSFISIAIAPFRPHPKRHEGLSLRICQTRLAHQPLLAGMKHCNRLEYLLARRESDDSAFDEGLLLDYDSRLIEGVMSNVFLVNGKHIRTPDLQQAGVAGTMRAALFERLPEHGYHITIATLDCNDLANADAVFLTNAVQGVMPVKRIQSIDKVYDIAVSQHIRQQMEHPTP